VISTRDREFAITEWVADSRGFVLVWISVKSCSYYN